LRRQSTREAGRVGRFGGGSDVTNRSDYLKSIEVTSSQRCSSEQHVDPDRGVMRLQARCLMERSQMCAGVTMKDFVLLLRLSIKLSRPQPPEASALSPAPSLPFPRPTIFQSPSLSQKTGVVQVNQSSNFESPEHRLISISQNYRPRWPSGTARRARFEPLEITRDT